MWEMQEQQQQQQRHYRGGSVSSERIGPPPGMPSTSEDLHAWSIYRQNLNSDFTDSALGSSEKSPAPYGNFHLRDQTVQSILSNPKYGPRSELGNNMYTYLKFGLPRVLAPRGAGGSSGITKDNSSGYDSTDEEMMIRARSVPPPTSGLRAARSEDFLNNRRDTHSALGGYKPDLYHPGEHHAVAGAGGGLRRQQKHIRAVSEANLLDMEHHHRPRSRGAMHQQQQQQHQQRRSRSRSRLDDPEPAEYITDEHQDQVAGHGGGGAAGDLINGAFVNHAMDDVLDHRAGRLGGRKAASQISIASRAYLQNGGVSYRHDAPMLNDKYFPKDAYGGSNAYLGQTNVSIVPHGGMVTNGQGDYDGFKYPHLQLRNISLDVRKKEYRNFCCSEVRQRVLDGISMETRGGELVAIMATKREEGTALCDILANNLNRWTTQMRGNIVLNGVPIEPSKLTDRVAYVKTDHHFTPDMSVRQTMLFHAFLREPGSHSRARDTKGRVKALIEDLGLAQVQHDRVGKLTASEKQRLNVACHLLLDADIVVLDEPTRGMDIFDTFFLVEYLRQWAARGRIVIMTLHPPTYEILTMISKIVLISMGKLMYFGKRREMLPYFAFIEYPCPAYKNPADYYLDLVTLDDLSAEAMVESSQRIDQMAAAYRRRSEPLSDPGPPAILPPKIKRANCVVQIAGLWMRAMMYMFPFNVIHWAKTVLLCGMMSVFIGGIFIGIRFKYFEQKDSEYEQDNINDRLGFHHCIMAVGIWPMLLSMISEAWREKRPVTRDVEDGLYSKLVYIMTKTIYGLPAAGGIFLAYVMPAYLLGGLHNDLDKDTFVYYSGYMLLYLTAMRVVALSMTHLFSSRHLAAALTGLIITSMALVSGYIVHPEEVGWWAQWFKYVSPQWWLSHPIVQDEFHPVSRFGCSGNPVIKTNQEIIQQISCGIPTGQAAISYYKFLGTDFVDQKIQDACEFIFLSKPDPQCLDKQSSSSDKSFSVFFTSFPGSVPILITVLFYVLFQLLDVVFFLFRRQESKQSRAKKHKME